MTSCPTPALTPDLALAYLGELSTDIRAAAMLDGAGSVAAHAGFEDGEPTTSQSSSPTCSTTPTPPGPPTGQLEVSLPEGIVFALRDAAGRSRSWRAASPCRR